ncbi:MAG: hypothetical protein WD081_06330 [Gammaproteobacteria bacterium]
MSSEPTANRADQVGLARELVRAIQGAIADCEAFIASERAERLRWVVNAVGTSAVWFAWAWAAVLAFYLLAMPAADLPANTATADLGPRAAVLVVLALAIGGPISLFVAWFVLKFFYTIVVDALAPKLPRAFASLASPLVLLTSLAVLWLFRASLHAVTWRIQYEIGIVLEIAGQFTPLGST